MDKKDNPKTERLWIPERGDPVAIRDMTESHAKNALAYVMHVIDAGHPVWTDAKGMFRYDPCITLPQPFDVQDAINSIIRLQIYLEMYQEYMEGRSPRRDEDGSDDE